MRPTLLIAVILSLLFAPLAEADWKTTRKQFDRLWKTGDPEKRADALKLMGDEDGERAAKLMVSLLGKRGKVNTQALHRRKIEATKKRAEYMASKGMMMMGGTLVAKHDVDPDVMKKIEKLAAEIQRIDGQILLAQRGMDDEITRAMSKLLDDRALAYLYRCLGRSDALVPRCVLSALGAGGIPASAPHVRKYVADRRDGVALAAIEATVKLKDAKGVRSLLSALSHKTWQVRSAAAGALGQLGDRRVVEPLIRRLFREKGRMEEEIDGALYALTGKSFGGNARAWARWLKSHRGSLAKIVAEARKKQREKTDEPDVLTQKGWTTTFYGIPSTSRRVVFVIDVSGSMRMAPGGPPKMGQPMQDPGGATKLSVCKVELRRAIKALPADALFNIIYYSDLPRMYREEGMVTATSANKAAVLSWIDTGLRANGGTNMYGALTKVFSLCAGKGSRKDQAPDTVYLMTDGAPSTGRLTDPGQIVEDVKVRNARLRLKFNCIAVGPINGGLLDKIAADSGGKCVRFGAPE